MTNPDFQPLTLTLEEWRVFDCECMATFRDNPSCDTCVLRREAEAQARAAASLRQRLDDKEQARAFMQRELAESDARVVALRQQLEQAQKERDALTKAVIEVTGAYQEDGDWAIPAEPFEVECSSLADCLTQFGALVNKEFKRMEHAEAQLAGLQRMLDELFTLLPDVESAGHDKWCLLAKKVAELQRRRSLGEK